MDKNTVYVKVSAKIRSAADRDDSLRAMRALLDEILRMGEYMESRTENDPDLSEEDKFLVLAFETDYPAVGSPATGKWHRDTVQKLSSDYPELVFILDQSCNSNQFWAGHNEHFVYNYRRIFVGGHLRMSM